MRKCTEWIRHRISKTIFNYGARPYQRPYPLRRRLCRIYKTPILLFIITYLLKNSLIVSLEFINCILRFITDFDALQTDDSFNRLEKGKSAAIILFHGVLDMSLHGIWILGDLPPFYVPRGILV